MVVYLSHIPENPGKTHASVHSSGMCVQRTSTFLSNFQALKLELVLDSCLHLMVLQALIKLGGVDPPKHLVTESC